MSWAQYPVFLTFIQSVLLRKRGVEIRGERESLKDKIGDPEGLACVEREQQLSKRGKAEIVKEKRVKRDVKLSSTRSTQQNIFSMKIVDLQSLRKNALEQSDALSNKPRFALFSQPPPLYLGQCFYKNTKVRRNNDGQVVTQPRNALCGRLKKAMNGTFSSPQYQHQPYHDIGKILNKTSTQKDKDISTAKFRPQNCYKAQIKAAYQHMSQLVDQKNKPHAFQPKNMLVISSKRADQLISVFPEFMSDPIQNKRAQQLKQLQKHHEMMKESFRTYSAGGKLFSTNIEMFNQEQFQQQKVVKKHQVKGNQNKQIFKYSNPNKTGWMGSFQKFPQYIPEPPLKRVKSLPRSNPCWKPRSPNYLERPTPSVVISKFNLRRQLRARAK